VGRQRHHALTALVARRRWRPVRPPRKVLRPA
jgi:hypothetical protein